MSKVVVLPDSHPHLTSARLRLGTFRPIEGEGPVIPPPPVAERAKAEGAKMEHAKTESGAKSGSQPG